MKITQRVEKSSSPDWPEAEPSGVHLVTDLSEWVPGPHPDPHRREEEQRRYLERYVRCIRCGLEVLSRNDLPDECIVVGGRR